MTGMSHADPEDLALYAAGALGMADLHGIEDHLKRCAECRMTVSMLRQIKTMEELNLLPTAEGAELFPSAPGRPESKDKKSDSPGSGKLFGGVFGIATGLGLFHHGAAHSTPALAAGAGFLGHSADSDPTPGAETHAGHPEDSSHDPVRNAFHFPSERLESGNPAAFETGHTQGDPMAAAHPHQTFPDAPTAFGQPPVHGSSEYIHQQYSDTCAVQCQHLILNQFGVDVSEEQLMREATDRGIYHPGHGTPLDDVGKLLELHGVPVHREMNANVFNLAIELSQGHKVIVGLDSGELWHSHPLLQDLANTLGIGQADHAVIVSGIDTSEPGHEKIIVTDPGTGDIARSYPVQQFLDAWEGSHFALVATSDPAPPFNQEMVNFDYALGHVPTVGDAPYELVQQMAATAGHEADYGILHRLENLFLHVVSGEFPMGAMMNALAHDNPAHHSMADLTSLLNTFAHGTNPSGAIGALLDQFTDIGMAHSGLDPMHHHLTMHPDLPTGHEHLDHDPHSILADSAPDDDSLGSNDSLDPYGDGNDS